MEVDSQDQLDVSMKDGEQDNTEVSTVGTPSSRGDVLRIVDQTIDDGGAVKYTVVWENGDTTEVRLTPPSTTARQTRAQCFKACGLAEEAHCSGASISQSSTITIDKGAGTGHCGYIYQQPGDSRTDFYQLQGTSNRTTFIFSSNLGLLAWNALDDGLLSLGAQVPGKDTSLCSQR